ncbi:hypothetical protein [Aestuariibaculum marinum]|uniref:Uncharacterized protein n=1 Tax=Aestuariibaculum marinum TaxID=2683592 RepID=A0A8J6Q0F4_9FLAO|nr:hypothetical protein [Aestuariibaculum marinum]MBD0822603.1 hypothetical protein [Aestuariibaculum marinum]
MKNIILYSIYLLSFYVFSQEETNINNLVMDNIEPAKTIALENITFYESPSFDKKSGVIKVNDSFNIVNYYRGIPYRNITFYNIRYKGQKGYINSKRKLKMSNYRISFEFEKEINMFKDSISRIKTKKEREERLARQMLADSLKNDLYFNKCSYIKNEVDEFEGYKIISTIDYIINDPKLVVRELRIQLARVKNEKFVIFSSYDLGCTSPYKSSKSYVKVKLENNDIITFYHHGDIDCGDEFRLYGRISESEIARLKSSEIKTVRLSGTEGYLDVDVDYFKDFFIKKLKCIE